MPRQNTSPSHFPAPVLEQIAKLAEVLVHQRKASGATQAQWAAQLGISQPTMARLERGDPAIATATYVACLMLVHPQLNLLDLLPPSQVAAVHAASTAPQTGPNIPPPPSAADEFAALLAQWQVPAL